MESRKNIKTKIEMRKFIQVLRKSVLPFINIKRFRYIKGLTNLNFFEVHVTDHCNLNCRSCDHFSPLSNPYFIDLNKLEEDYRLLAPVSHRFFNQIHLMGGEPLLHPEIEKIMILTRTYFPKTTIWLYTNGIKLLSMQESFWKTCSEYSIQIYISKYPINIHYKQVCAIMDKWHLIYAVSTEVEYFFHYALDPSGKQNHRKSYETCDWGGVYIQLKNGILYPCARIAYIEKVNNTFGLKLKCTKEDFLEIKKLSRWNFLKFVTKSKPFCRYCTMERRKVSWVHSCKSKEEWL